MMRRLCPLLLCCLLLTPAVVAKPLNVVFITVDDMNCDSVGAFGCQVPDITPNIDRLAADGMRFEHAHVTIAICQPTRAVWMTGRYPHNSGALGFDPIRPDVPTLVEALHAGGYYTGIMAKTGHVVPSRAAAFDERIAAKRLSNGRDPQKYFEFTTQFLKNAAESGKPFFLMANAQDPHRPFFGSRQESSARRRDRKSRSDQYGGGFPDVRRVYSVDEVTVPRFLPDLPEVRKEIAQYYTSVHRADEVVGAVLKAVDEAGVRDSTLVLFMSDHGMPLPFAKTNVWRHSTRTPWIVRWPNVVEPKMVDAQHMVAGIDVTPTILDAVGLPGLPGMDGRSIVPILKGGTQQHRDSVFTHINTIASKRSYSMRSVQTKRFGYIFNAWSDGETVFRNESQSGLTMAAMRKAAADDDPIAARVAHFVYRTPEELYDYEQDPDALHNLIGDPAHAETVAKFRRMMRDRMQSTGDFLAESFGAAVKQSGD